MVVRSNSFTLFSKVKTSKKYFFPSRKPQALTILMAKIKEYKNHTNFLFQLLDPQADFLHILGAQG